MVSFEEIVNCVSKKAFEAKIKGLKDKQIVSRCVCRRRVLSSSEELSQSCHRTRAWHCTIDLSKSEINTIKQKSGNL